MQYIPKKRVSNDEEIVFIDGSTKRLLVLLFRWMKKRNNTLFFNPNSN